MGATARAATDTLSRAERLRRRRLSTAKKPLAKTAVRTHPESSSHKIIAISLPRHQYTLLSRVLAEFRQRVHGTISRSGLIQALIDKELQGRSLEQLVLSLGDRPARQEATSRRSRPRKRSSSREQLVLPGLY